MTDRDLLISQYIDNELSLSEKAEFVKEINRDDSYMQETLKLLDAETDIDMAVPEPPAIKPVKRPADITRYVSFAALAASLILMVKVFMFAPEAPQPQAMQRFVIYAPDAQKVSLSGSFSSWSPVKMQKTDGGYWQTEMKLDNGEYTYSFIIDDSTSIPDPTSAARQNDGFGGENSVLTVGDKI